MRCDISQAPNKYKNNAKSKDHYDSGKLQGSVTLFTLCTFVEMIRVTKPIVNKSFDLGDIRKIWEYNSLFRVHMTLKVLIKNKMEEEYIMNSIMEFANREEFRKWLNEHCLSVLK